MPNAKRYRSSLTIAATLTALAATPLLPTATAKTGPPPPPRTTNTQSSPTQHHAHVSTAYELPGDRAYPEGIAADPRTGDVYVGSYATGAVYKATPGKRAAEVFLPAGTDGRKTANGLKVDRSGRLWVTDSTAGVAVYDLRSRALIARFDVPGTPGGEPRMVNDVTIAADGTAYLTDSFRAVIYRVTPAQLEKTARHEGRRGELTAHLDLSGALEPQPAGTFTLNGLVADPTDPTGRRLFTVDMTGGDLYRVDTASGEIRKVTLHGGDLTNGDGLELRGSTLWAVHNTTNSITRWRLTDGGAAARLERRVTDEALQIPTTLVRSHGRTLVVRSQFDKGGPMGPGTPTTPFTVAAVDGI
ncbi:SMP-30/gluconolactonase/LRE family protein [Streptomyces sp. NPDC059037]|uniref:SMP-30/gluconolactonase/LRE family protein n=1 Tax=Streptomyces sp. NPDC059037 TaxID=3346710 RepID=UPI0036A50D23